MNNSKTQTTPAYSAKAARKEAKRQRKLLKKQRQSDFINTYQKLFHDEIVSEIQDAVQRGSRRCYYYYNDETNVKGVQKYLKEHRGYKSEISKNMKNTLIIKW